MSMLRPRPVSSGSGPLRAQVCRSAIGPGLWQASTARKRNNEAMSVVDDYLQGVEPERRAALERIRAIVRQVVPDVEEALSYGMPAFKYRKRPLLGFTARPHHLSVHPFSPAVIESLRHELVLQDLSKGTIRFTLDNPIPEATLREIIARRMAEIR